MHSQIDDDDYEVDGDETPEKSLTISMLDWEEKRMKTFALFRFLEYTSTGKRARAHKKWVQLTNVNPQRMNDEWN